jgi:hypothetical protein
MKRGRGGKGGKRKKKSSRRDGRVDQTIYRLLVFGVGALPHKFFGLTATVNNW